MLNPHQQTMPMKIATRETKDHVSLRRLTAAAL